MKTTNNATQFSVKKNTQEEKQTALRRWMKPLDLEEEFDIKMNNQAQMRSKKKIPFSKVGGYIFYDRIKIDKWLEDNDMGDVK